jgi:hypothetical protein
MRSLAFPAILLSLAVSHVSYAQYAFEDFLKAVESGQQNNARLNSPRLAQLPTGPEELPAPKPNLPESAGSLLNQAQASPSDLNTAVPGAAATKNAAPNSDASGHQAPLTPAPEPVPLHTYSETAAPSHAMPVLPQINFEDAFAQQEIGMSADSHYQGAGGSDCGCNARSGASHASGSSCSSGSCGTRSCAVMAHSPAHLPPPSTLHGYFNASPCIANVWDNYACEAGKECRKTHSQIQMSQSTLNAGCSHRAKCE